MMVRSPVEICFDTKPGAEVAAFAEHISGAACWPASSVRDTHLPSLNHHLRTVAVVFNFVNPVLALWRLIDRGSKLRLDKPEPCHYAEHHVLYRLVVLKERGIANPNKG